MDKLIISGQGFPGANEYLAFAESSSHDQINAIVRAIGDNVIFDGVVDDNGNTSAGWIIYNNEILPFEASETGETVVIIETVTEAAYDTSQTGNFNQILPVWKNRKAKFGDPGDAGVVASFDFGTLNRIRTVKTLDGLLEQATEEILGLNEIATQDETNDNDNDTHVITPKKLNARKATTERRGVVELVTNQEAINGVDDERAVTIAALKAAGYLITRVSQGTIILENQINSNINNSNDWTKNYGFIYPPIGFTIEHLVGVSMSFNFVGFSDYLEDNEEMWMKHQIDGDKVRVIAQVNKNDRNTKINYTAIWQK
ncbi:hypothetical protein [Winogradskyella luteola]|uniref:Uncharacterized protein n=1 Tax=Winogradskyella luteola TaxID=2828330 RepID=A0A9X1F750_9FLAO|nr:hypothetical protein [Winogradskyella luteola]MBV7268356.1 hypothetical protein [Winogradskyella luteola]